MIFLFKKTQHYEIRGIFKNKRKTIYRKWINKIKLEIDGEEHKIIYIDYEEVEISMLYAFDLVN